MRNMRFSQDLRGPCMTKSSIQGYVKEPSNILGLCSRLQLRCFHLMGTHLEANDRSPILVSLVLSFQDDFQIDTSSSYMETFFESCREGMSRI